MPFQLYNSAKIIIISKDLTDLQSYDCMHSAHMCWHYVVPLAVMLSKACAVGGTPKLIIGRRDVSDMHLY